MGASCELIEKCGYFKKNKDSKEAVCKGFMLMYCNGDKQNECRRKEYRKVHGAPPPDNMLPNGIMVQA